MYVPDLMDFFICLPMQTMGLYTELNLRDEFFQGFLQSMPGQSGAFNSQWKLNHTTQNRQIASFLQPGGMLLPPENLEKGIDKLPCFFGSFPGEAFAH